MRHTNIISAAARENRFVEGIFHFGHDSVSTTSEPLVLKGTCLGNDVRASNLNYYILKVNTNAGNAFLGRPHGV